MANDNANQNMSQEGRAKGGRDSGGNFKHDREKARRAGKKGGESSSGNQYTS